MVDRRTSMIPSVQLLSLQLLILLSLVVTTTTTTTTTIWFGSINGAFSNDDGDSPKMMMSAAILHPVTQDTLQEPSPVLKMTTSTYTSTNSLAPPNNNNKSADVSPWPETTTTTTKETMSSTTTTTTKIVTKPSSSSSSSSAPSNTIFTNEQRQAFKRDGYLVVSGLLDDDHIHHDNDHPRHHYHHTSTSSSSTASTTTTLTERLVQAGHDFLSTRKLMDAYFSSIEMGMIYKAGGGDATSATPTTATATTKGNNNNNQTFASTSTSSITDVFRQVAFESILPSAVAELLDLDPTKSNEEQLYILRDVFMSKPVKSDTTCDWHADDIGFWPEAYKSKKDGINVWIAMEDMPSEYGGSMALSPGSHVADWRHDAYDSIGLNLTFRGGFTRDEAAKMAQSGHKLLMTCEMGKQAPELRNMIEDTKTIPNIRKGDVIFATRFLFHRTEPVTEEGKSYYAEKGIDYLNRYSIRFVPGSAKLPDGWTFEWSMKSNKDIEGKSVYKAMEEDENLPWYPRAWPTPNTDLYRQLDILAETELEPAKAQSKAELFELFSLWQNSK